MNRQRALGLVVGLLLLFMVYEVTKVAPEAPSASQLINPVPAAVSMATLSSDSDRLLKQINAAHVPASIIVRV